MAEDKKKIKKDSVGEKQATGTTMTGSPADKIVIDPLVVTEKAQRIARRLKNVRSINEIFENTFEKRAEFDEIGRHVPRPQTGPDVNKNLSMRGEMLKSWIARTKQQEIQKKIIDNA